jgi:hypothetical protein
MNMQTTLLDRREASRAPLDDLTRLAKAWFGPSRGIVNKVKPLAQRPRCINCRKTYGIYDSRVWVGRFGICETIPDYTGPDFLVSENIEVGGDKGPEGCPGCEVTRYTWDGRTYRGANMSDPFCTMRCAAMFGLLAYKAGFRRQGQGCRK